jgi:hypothetical protein
MVGQLDYTLTLSERERQELLLLLEQHLKQLRVEEHRTEASNFRQHMTEKVSVLERLTDKLRQCV